MKTLLVLSDHSYNAAHAAAQAVRLAGKLHANIMLAHSYVLVPVGEYATVVPMMGNENIVLEHESEERLKAEAAKLRELAKALPKSDHRPHIHYVQHAGDPGTLVKDLCETYNIELIILGASHDSAFAHFFFGSDSGKVLAKANRPVLFLPQDVDVHNLQKVVFATNFDENDLLALRYLTGLGTIYHFELMVTHVRQHGDSAVIGRLLLDDFRKKTEALRYPHIFFKEIGGEDIPERLTKFCHEQHVGLLAMGHQQHSLIGRLLHKSIARAMINTQMPLLVFPSSMNEA